MISEWSINASQWRSHNNLREEERIDWLKMLPFECEWSFIINWSNSLEISSSNELKGWRLLFDWIFGTIKRSFRSSSICFSSIDSTNTRLTRPIELNRFLTTNHGFERGLSSITARISSSKQPNSFESLGLISQMTRTNLTGVGSNNRRSCWLEVSWASTRIEEKHFFLSLWKRFFFD